ncbi:CynX/NimT family MFS transporter [Albibacterium bauzanense]|uniref:CP family cyanate transporter-like MFS transporter n=1 Tax=Albibacterium bauzanense TaxID=653929 RepID=A0A4R1LZK8_9SPHI|nr:MFS transporter [Albibacterium bauzanense]TCK84765.1 CP family cyanate transporter-like MFS transporter [Albibacterium bauzanense]
MIKEEEKEDTPLFKDAPAKTRFDVIIMAVGVVIVGATLRAPITSVGPVILEITEQLSLTPVLVGLITTIPLMSFALLSVLAPKAAKRIGLEKLLLYSMLVLAFGLLVRSVGNVFLLFIGAALIGAAITIGNVLMPAFIKKEFPNKVGLITGFYLVSMNLTSALAVGFSISIGQSTGLGWKASIGIWGVLALIAFLIWLPQIKQRSGVESESTSRLSSKALWKSRLAWQISILMGLQSFFFYTLAAWLPAALQSWGMSAESSGWMLSYIQMGQLPIMLIGPIVAGKMKDQTSLMWITFILLLLGLLGIIIWKTEFIIISVILIGVSLGLAYTLVTMFFILRTKHSSESANLSGMAQSVGYLIAATGPPLFGALYSLTNNWYVPFALLLVAAVFLLTSGLASSKDRYVS